MTMTKEALSEYHKGWYQRKKSGLPTRLHPTRAIKERIENKKEISRKWAAAAYQKRIQLRAQFCGGKCHFCNRTFRLVAHRKDGKSHEDFSNFSISDLIKEFQTGQYITLCYACHKGVHWAMKFFRFSWEELSSLVISKKKFWMNELEVVNHRQTGLAKRKEAKFIILGCKCGKQFPIEESQYKYRIKIGQTEFHCSRNCGAINFDKTAQVKEGIRDGLTGKQIVEKYKISRYLVHYYMKKYGPVAQQ